MGDPRFGPTGAAREFLTSGILGTLPKGLLAKGNPETQERTVKFRGFSQRIAMHSCC